MGTVGGLGAWYLQKASTLPKPPLNKTAFDEVMRTMDEDVRKFPPSRELPLSELEVARVMKLAPEIKRIARKFGGVLIGGSVGLAVLNEDPSYEFPEGTGDVDVYVQVSDMKYCVGPLVSNSGLEKDRSTLQGITGLTCGDITLSSEQRCHHLSETDILKKQYWLQGFSTCIVGTIDFPNEKVGRPLQFVMVDVSQFDKPTGSGIVNPEIVENMKMWYAASSDLPVFIFIDKRGNMTWHAKSAIEFAMAKRGRLFLSDRANSKDRVLKYTKKNFLRLLSWG